MDDVVNQRFGQMGREQGEPTTGSMLDRVTRPADLQALTTAELETLCSKIRDYIVDVVSQRGGTWGRVSASSS